MQAPPHDVVPPEQPPGDDAAADEEPPPVALPCAPAAELVDASERVDAEPLDAPSPGAPVCPVCVEQLADRTATVHATRPTAARRTPP